jgi:hypothetical protein
MCSVLMIVCDARVFLFSCVQPAPKSNVIGFQMMIAAAMGFFAVYTNLKSVAQALFVFSQYRRASLGRHTPHTRVPASARPYRRSS